MSFIFRALEDLAEEDSRDVQNSGFSRKKPAISKIVPALSIGISVYSAEFQAAVRHSDSSEFRGILFENTSSLLFKIFVS